MRIAVLSDIHSNAPALRVCVDAALARGITKFFFLGDYAGEFAYPQQTMELIYKLRASYECYFIRGNKEDYWLKYRRDGAHGWEEGSSTTGAMLYAYQNLTEKDLDFYEEMDISQTVCFDGLPPVTFCHGSPRRVNEKMLENENTRAVAAEQESDLILCGHTHVQKKIVFGKKTVINGGSVGIPDDAAAAGKAQFVILHGESGEWREEFVTLGYDTKQVIRDLHEAGLFVKAPYWTRVTEYILRKGLPSHGTVLARAMELCREAEGVCNWPHVPEEYMRRAMEELIPEENTWR